MDGELPKHYVQILQEERSKTVSSPTSCDKVTTPTTINGRRDEDTTSSLSDKLVELNLSEGLSSNGGFLHESNGEIEDQSSTSWVTPRSVIDYYTNTAPTKEFDYVVEVYGFHPSLKTKDILKELHIYGSLKMRLKWVNDNHALAIYSNAKDALIASKGLYSSIKVMLLSKSDNVDSLDVAEKVAESMRDSLSEMTCNLQPKVRRPQTTSTVARRMVGHALGVKINVPSEKDQQEKLKIQNAREEKRNRQKQSQQQ